MCGFACAYNDFNWQSLLLKYRFQGIWLISSKLLRAHCCIQPDWLFNDSKVTQSKSPQRAIYFYLTYVRVHERWNIFHPDIWRVVDVTILDATLCLSVDFLKLSKHFCLIHVSRENTSIFIFITNFISLLLPWWSSASYV